jgi:dienelactone hydrolase
MLSTTGLLALMTLVAAGGDDAPGSWSAAAGEFGLGPVPPTVDLRNMLTRHIVRRCCESLDAVADHRREAFTEGTWQAWRGATRKAVAEALEPMPFGERGGDLNVRHVSRHDRPGYVVENVLFESLPGLDVNASMYLPLAPDYPPPWRAIVVPVGHSAKTRESYQIPAQVFARMGYVAITFDPPGMAGEKGPGNDHFKDGVRCYLTGQSSNRYFVIDALRCIDYLATRADIDLSNGVGMTGVSGGGTTTMFATLLDDRIAASGPSCCAVPNALHPVLDNYAPCAETLAQGRFQHYDDIDLLVAAMPTPVLLMAGAGDEVFTKEMSQRMADEVAASFQSSGHEERFGFFLDPGGHAYTVAMAVEFAKWMDRWVSKTPNRSLPVVAREDFEMLPDEQLACKPRTDRNIFSVNADVAVSLRQHRSGLPVSEAAALVARVDGSSAVPEARVGKPALDWFHDVQEVMLKPEADIELPATFLYPARQEWKGAAVLYFDPRGRWTDLRQQGVLANMTGFTNEGTDGPAIFTVDLRGWGDSKPADLPYDIAGWGHRDRWLSYVSAALGDHVLAMRIRDGLSALAYLRARPEIEPERIVVGGRGMGGVVALHVAAIDGKIRGVFAIDALASFRSLATSTAYSWSHQDFLPEVLKHYDLPDLAAALEMPTFIMNPLGPTREPLPGEEFRALYTEAWGRGDDFLHASQYDTNAIQAFVRRLGAP